MKIKINHKRIMKEQEDFGEFEQQEPVDPSEFDLRPPQDPSRPPKVMVLFDGAGFARLGLLQAGWDAYGIELNPVAHWLSTHIGDPSKVALGDAAAFLQGQTVGGFNIKDFDAIWASPPCQKRSVAKRGSGGKAEGKYKQSLLAPSIKYPKEAENIQIFWVENVLAGKKELDTGKRYNALQFAGGRSNRNRMIWGDYPAPKIERDYKTFYKELASTTCPAITATEYKATTQSLEDVLEKYGRETRRRATRWFVDKGLGKPTWQTLAYYMGMDDIPGGWEEAFNQFATKESREALEDLLMWQIDNPDKKLTPSRMREVMYRAVGNAVPVSMARAFGEAGMEAFRRAVERESPESLEEFEKSTTGSTQVEDFDDEPEELEPEEELDQEVDLPNQVYRNGRWTTEPPEQNNNLQETMFRQVGKGLFRTNK